MSAVTLLSTALTISMATALLQAPLSGSISGTLRTDSGEPQAGVRVAAIPVSENGGAQDSVLVSITQTGKDGRYRLEEIPPGRYYIMSGRVANPTYYPGGTNVKAATVVGVTAGSALSGIDFKAVSTIITPSAQDLSLRRGATLSGRIVTKDGSALPSVPLSFHYLQSTAGGFVTVGGLVTVAADGRFSTPAPGGVNQVWISGLPRHYIMTSVRQDQTDYGHGPVFLVPTLGNVELLITVSILPAP